MVNEEDDSVSLNLIQDVNLDEECHSDHKMVVLGVAYGKEMKIKSPVIEQSTIFITEPINEYRSIEFQVSNNEEIQQNSLLNEDNTNIIIKDMTIEDNTFEEQSDIDSEETPTNEIDRLIEIERSELNEQLIDPETGEMKKRGDKSSNKKRIMCQKCDKTFCSNFMLMEHTKVVHDKIADKQCDLCDYKTARRSCLVLHKRKKHQKWKPYKCSEEGCDFTAYHLYQVDNHINLQHKKIRPFPCEYSGCDYSGVSRSAINLHVKRVHKKENKYSCPYCDYKSNKNYGMKDHINSKHLKIKPFQCSECDFLASTKGVVSNHFKRVHLGIVKMKNKIHKCTYCDYSTDNKQHHQDHVNSVHLGIKQFRCGICEFDCASKASMKRHVLIHTGIKKFSCDVCDYKSSRKVHLQEHVANVHIKSFDFNCNYCSYKTSTKQRLQKHMRQQHKTVKTTGKDKSEDK